MGLDGVVEYVIGGIIAIFIIIIFFTAIAPSIIDTINNANILNPGSIGLPSATILIVTLIPLAVVVGMFMMFWRKINSPDQPPGYGGGY